MLTYYSALILVNAFGDTISNWVKALIFIAPAYIRFIIIFIKRVYQRYKMNAASNENISS